jgi:hypothetical protein
MSESNREEISAPQNAASALVVNPVEASHTVETSMAAPVKSPVKAQEFNDQTNYVSKGKIITVSCFQSDELCCVSHSPID